MVNVNVLQSGASEPAEEVKTPWLIKFLAIAIVVTMPYQLVYLSAGETEGGYICDIFIMALMVVGWVYILWKRKAPQFPLIFPLGLMLAGSLMGTILGYDRTEALSTIIRDIYIWLLFYTLFNVIRERKTLHTLIYAWVVVAVLESALIWFAMAVTSGQTIQRADMGNSAQLHAIGAPSLANMSGSYIQAKHQIKRAQLHSYGAFVPGVGSGTFSNADFTALYLSESALIALAMPLKRWRWPRYLLAAFFAATSLLTGTSAPIGAIPVAFALYILLVNPPRRRIAWITVGAIGAALGALAYVATPYLTGTDIFTLAGELAGQSESETAATQSVAGITTGMDDRVRLIRDGWREFERRPLGVGPHGMRASGVEKNVHNEYVSYLYERGFLGLVGLLLMRGTVVVLGIISAVKANQERKAVIAGLLGAFVVQVIFDLAHEVMRQRDVCMLTSTLVIYISLEFQHQRLKREAALKARWPWAYPKSVHSTAGA